MFRNLRMDLAAYGGDWSAQGFWAMAVYRFGRARYAISWPLLRKPFSLLYKLLFKLTQVITGIELPCEVPVGRGLRIDHFGGVVVSGYAAIGDHCVLRNGVTIGLRREDHPVAPRLGDRVNVGAGAKILGDITIGDDVTVGANAVVLSDVPSNCLAVGIPARVISKDADHRCHTRELDQKLTAVLEGRL